MLNFDESRVRQEHENGIALITALFGKCSRFPL